MCDVLLCFEGIFAPLGRVSKFGSLSLSASRGSLQKLNHGKIQVSHITAKVDTGDNVNLPVQHGACFVQGSCLSRKLEKVGEFGLIMENKVSTAGVANSAECAGLIRKNLPVSGLHLF